MNINNDIPSKGFSRFLFCLKDSFNSVADKYTDSYKNNISNRIEGTSLHRLSQVSPRKVTLASIFLAATATAYIYPQQALGLYGFYISYLATSMRENRNMRSMYAFSCPFFAAQYALDIEIGLAGLISASSGAVRGTLLTMIPDDEVKKRKILASTFAIVSASAVSAISLYSGNYQNLVVLPAFALSASADYMGDRKSHTARFLRFGAFTTVLMYDSFISGNLGSGLSSFILMLQTYRTANQSGDFDFFEAKNNRPSQMRQYLRSLTINK